MRDAAPLKPGLGNNREIELDGFKLFAKSLPVTQQELSSPFGTRNIHSLPAAYSYGVGSAGFRAGREWAMHQKTTQWVLDGACPHFPLMFHHRLLPAGARAPAMRTEELAAYTRSWNGNPSIGRFMSARATATHEILVLLEHVPFVLRDWFLDKPEAATPFIEQMGETARFLSERGVVHFDAHSGNILTDGETFYLTDFGLSMDRSFDLSSTEQAFLLQHRHYDLGLILCALWLPFSGAIQNLAEDSLRALSRRYGDTQIPTLASHLPALVEKRLLDLPDAYVQTVSPHLDVFIEMNRFLIEMSKPSKSARYRDSVVAAAIRRSV